MSCQEIGAGSPTSPGSFSRLQELPWPVQPYWMRLPPAAGAGYAFAPDTFREGYNTIRVANAGTSVMTIEWVELSLRFPRGN